MLLMRHLEPPLCQQAWLAQLLLFKHFIPTMKRSHP
jgi:hypothetical protein